MLICCMEVAYNFSLLLLCRLERKKYHIHREKLRSSPEKHVTLIVDGMDQAKTNIPNTKVITKSTSGLWRLRTHVSGILIHTKSPCGKLVFAFVDLVYLQVQTCRPPCVLHAWDCLP